MRIADGFLIVFAAESLAWALAIIRAEEVFPRAVVQTLTAAFFQSPTYASNGCVLAADRNLTWTSAIAPKDVGPIEVNAAGSGEGNGIADARTLLPGS